MESKSDLMKERTFSASVELYHLLSSKTTGTVSKPLVNQLIRSSSSVAANYRSATRGRSDAEFYSKICIVVEECDETLFWIDYLLRVKFLSDKEAHKIRDEIEQLLKIFNATKKTMKEKLRKK